MTFPGTAVEGELVMTVTGTAQDGTENRIKNRAAIQHRLDILVNPRQQSLI